MTPFAKKEQQAIPDEIILDFNIDGVNHSKSTKRSLWIIQMSLRNFTQDPFVIGTFCGRQKPDCNDLLKDFVNEINEIILNGIQHNEKSISIKVGFFSCDKPANSYIRGSKGHTRKYSCVKCPQKGVCLNHRLVFPEITRTNKTDEDFGNRKHPQHHVKDSILEDVRSRN